MRSGSPLNFGPLSFLLVLLLLCLFGAISYSVISGGGSAAFLIVFIPGASASLLSFLVFLLREKKVAHNIRSHSIVQTMHKIEDNDFSVRLQPGQYSTEQDLHEHFNTMAAKLEENKTELQDLFAKVEKGKKEWEATFDAVPDLIVLLDRDQRILRVNRAMADKLGGHPRDVIGKFCCPVIHGTQTAPDFCCHKEVISRGKEVQKEIFDPRLGGHLLFSMSPVFNEAGELISVVQIGRNINELRDATNDLHKARGFMQQTIDSISETLLIIDNDYRVLLANQAARKRFLLNGSKEENEELYCFRAIHGFDEPCHQVGAIRCPLLEVRKIGLPVSVVHQHTDRQGVVVHEELSATPFLNDDGQIGGIIEVGRDIGERLRLEEENKKLIRKEARFRKDQSIGTLAGGVAHDFNNGLTAVLGNAELLKFNLSQDKESQKYIEQIIAAVHKMTNLTRQMLAYAKGGNYHPLQIDISKTVQSALSELRKREDFSGLSVALDFEGNVWPLLGDARQLQQAFGNILVNSYEAMKERGGTLLVKIENQSFASNWECTFNEIHPQGDFVHIGIQDSGLGIPQEDLERVFEPFFTTKFMGRGLGLPAALGIIQNHGGCITIETKQNYGTTLNVFLPRFKEIKDQNSQRLRTAFQGKVGWKILVVDDESPVLEYLKTGLQLNGFEVITAMNGFEAMEKINLQKEEIGLVILDVFMPGLDGKAVYRQIKAIRPGIRIALSSGYDEQIALSGLDLQKEDTFLPKPYDLKVLLELAARSVTEKA